MRIIFLPFLIAFACTNLISPEIRAQTVRGDSGKYSTRVLHIQGNRYKVLLTTVGCFILKGNDTIVRHEGDYFFMMTVKDFNNDGYSDILIGRSEIRPNVFDLLLYDPVVKTFKEVKDFDFVPSAMPIPNTKLYYSYYSTGCSDANWISELFYIEHFRTVIIGKIEGTGCETYRSRSIHIYKGIGTEFSLFRALPISNIAKYGDKWSFIKHYWVQMHKRFL